MLLSILQIWTIHLQFVVTPASTVVTLFVNVGDTAELNCAVMHNRGDGQWLRLKSDGEDSIEKVFAIGDIVNLSFKGSERFTAYSNSTLYILKITSIEEDDAGRYQCHISGSPVLEFKLQLLSEEDVSSTKSSSDVTQYNSTASLFPDTDLKTRGIIILSGSGFAVILILSIIVKCVCIANRGLTTTSDQTNSHVVNPTLSAYPMYEEVRSTNNESVSEEDQMRRREATVGSIVPEGRLFHQNIRHETQQNTYESLSSERSDVHIYKDIFNV